MILSESRDRKIYLTKDISLLFLLDYGQVISCVSNIYFLYTETALSRSYSSSRSWWFTSKRTRGICNVDIDRGVTIFLSKYLSGLMWQDLDFSNLRRSQAHLFLQLIVWSLTLNCFPIRFKFKCYGQTLVSWANGPFVIFLVCFLIYESLRAYVCKIPHEYLKKNSKMAKIREMLIRVTHLTYFKILCRNSYYMF